MVSSITQEDQFRLLPSIDELLRRVEMQATAARDGHAATVAAAREFLDQLRAQIAAGSVTESQIAMAVEDV